MDSILPQSPMQPNKSPKKIQKVINQLFYWKFNLVRLWEKLEEDMWWICYRTRESVDIWTMHVTEEVIFYGLHGYNLR
jgi:hypothetical protein